MKNIIPISIEDEIKRSYLDYAMSVIVGRALPDVRDGLKPVHRRILYGMFEQSNLSNKPYKKSARIVGDCMGKYHPHGDSAIYDALVRMAQDFSMRYPLIDGQGNFGSLDGDAAAAMRYTEVRLTPLAEELLKEDIDKETVDWTPNYDGSLLEPAVLPARFPNLLANGSSGIAVGMATNIPPHNLGELVDACLIVLTRKKYSAEDLLAVVPGPDFPTGGIINGREGIRQAYATGKGSLKVQARAVVETHPTKEGKQSLIVTELPYQVNKAQLVEAIAEHIKEKRLDGVSQQKNNRCNRVGRWYNCPTRPGAVELEMSADPTSGDGAEAQAGIPEDSPAVGKVIADLAIPRAAVFVSITRGNEVIIPRGDTQIQSGDVVTTLSEVDSIPMIKRILLSSTDATDAEPIVPNETND